MDNKDTGKDTRQVALVTGGTRGIGLGISRRMASAGYHLVLGYQKDHEAAARVREELQAHGVKVVTVAGDIRQPESIEPLFAAVAEHFDNRLTALVHNAGYAISASLPGGFTFEKYEEAQSVYPRAFLRLIERALPLMEDGRGRVVAISSQGAEFPNPVYSMSGAAKASMETLVRHYALALAPRGVTVNTVVPGYIKTEAWAGYLAAMPYIDKVVPEVTPLGRWGHLDDVAPLVAFLCAEESRFVTGQTIYADGGMVLSTFRNVDIIGKSLG